MCEYLARILGLVLKSVVLSMSVVVCSVLAVTHPSGVSGQSMRTNRGLTPVLNKKLLAVKPRSPECLLTLPTFLPSPIGVSAISVSAIGVLGQAICCSFRTPIHLHHGYSSLLTTWQSQDQTVATSGADDVLFALLLSLCRCGNEGRRQRSDRGRLTLHVRLSYAIAINVLEIIVIIDSIHSAI